MRGLAGEVLTCGCLAGVYETYEGRVVATIDARGASCCDPTHTRHAVVPRSRLRGAAAETEASEAPLPTRR
jgi:hypothetical protein